MISYFDYFPAKSKTELRTVTFVEEDSDSAIPPGLYVFTEYFCPDLSCDCQRVLVKVLQVLSETAPPQDVATISYTWHTNPDRSWASIIADTPNPHLDPLHPTSPFADELLELWHAMLQRDARYADRLQQHYHELRNHLAGSKNRPFFSVSKADRKSRQRRLAQRQQHRKKSK